MKKQIIFGIVGSTLLFALPAFAVDLSWTSDTNVEIASHTYVIVTGSAADSFEVTDTAVILTVPAASTFTFKSTDKFKLNNNQSIAQTCTANANTVVVTGPKTVTITPDPTHTCSTTTVSGGSGGGGSVTPTPTPTPSPIPTPSGSGNHHPNGTLILDADGRTVYLIKDNQRAGFRNEQEYFSYGYKFSQLVPASLEDQLPTGTIQKAMEGTLVLDASDNKTVYMIGLNSTKRGFTSAIVFKALGYSFANLPKINLADYPAGAPIGDAKLPHPDGALVLDGKTVWWIRGNIKQGFESEQVFGTYGFSFARVVPANAADLALAAGDLVKFRDGALVSENGAYFIISDGKKLMFTSNTDLVSRGYKLSNVINASLSNYPSAGNIQ